MSESLCPCGSGLLYSACCEPFHAGKCGAPTPEKLMRSRYSAFAIGDVEYLRETWAPETVPADLEIDPGQRWTRLRILDAPEVQDGEGFVRFRAHYRYGAERDFLEELSRFELRDGRWLYVDGDVQQ